MKILFISENPYTQIGGIENHIRNLGKYLGEKGIQSSYLNAKELGGFSILNKKLISNKIFKQKLLAIQPDIVHVHGFSSFFVNQCLSWTKKILSGTKLVYTPHYHPFMYHRHPVLAYGFFHVFLKKSIKNADILIALSQTEKTFFEQYFNVDKIRVIPNGINPVAGISKKTKPEKNNLLFVGRDDHNKRLDFLERQREYFSSHYIHCDIVTDVDKIDDEVFTYHKDLDTAQLTKLYEKSTVLVVPSKYEAFSIVALEAMALGVPVLLSDHVQIKSYLLDKDRFNKVFDYDNKFDFIQKLEEIIGLDPLEYQHSSKNNIAFAKSFEWNLVADKILEAYRN